MLRKKKVKEVEEVKEVKDCEAGIGWMAGEETKELTQRARRKNTEGTEKRSLHLENHRGRKRAKSARPVGAFGTGQKRPPRKAAVTKAGGRCNTSCVAIVGSLGTGGVGRAAEIAIVLIGYRNEDLPADADSRRARFGAPRGE